MTDANDDHWFHAAYEVFSSDHDEQRSRLLRMVAAAPSPDDAPGLTNGRVARAAVRRNLMRSLTVLIAVLLVALVIPFFWDGPGQKAHGIDDLPQRLLTIRSLDINGFMVKDIVNEDGEKQQRQFPFRYYFERPGKLWLETYGFSFPGEGQPTIVRRAVQAIDDDLHMLRLVDDNRTIVTQIDRRQTELRVEHLIQSQLLDQLLGGPPETFKKTASETVQGISCDVYEATHSRNDNAAATTHRVWLNPGTGVPLQVAYYSMKLSGEEELASMMNEIRVNEGVPADLFPLRDVDDLPPNPPDVAGGIGTISSGGAGPMRLGNWYALQLDETRALCCWTQHDVTDDGQHWFVREPEFAWASFGETVSAKTETVREFVNNQVHWRWSVVRTSTGVPIANRTLEISAKRKGSVISMSVKPLRFPEGRLQEIFDLMQTLAPGEKNSDVITLQTLLSGGR